MGGILAHLHFHPLCAHLHQHLRQNQTRIPGSTILGSCYQMILLQPRLSAFQDKISDSFPVRDESPSLIRSSTFLLETHLWISPARRFLLEQFLPLEHSLLRAVPALLLPLWQPLGFPAVTIWKPSSPDLAALGPWTDQPAFLGQAQTVLLSSLPRIWQTMLLPLHTKQYTPHGRRLSLKTEKPMRRPLERLMAHRQL
jgi:hypothetical protein